MVRDIVHLLVSPSSICGVLGTILMLTGMLNVGPSYPVIGTIMAITGFMVIVLRLAFIILME